MMDTHLSSAVAALVKCFHSTYIKFIKYMLSNLRKSIMASSQLRVWMDLVTCSLHFIVRLCSHSA